jgi:UDP-N-acetylglucosamine acyltransferase
VIHASAIVAPDAQLAGDVEVGPFTVIGPKVTVGARTWIGPHVVINGETTIGADNMIFQFASIGAAPQDKKYQGGPTRLAIGDRNVFREFCTINRGATLEHGLTSIGSDNLFMAYSHVAHDCLIGDHAIMVNCAGIAGHVELGDWTILSGYTGVHQFVKIGAHAFTGALTGVSQDIPPYVMATGHPAEPRGINVEGLKRRGFTAEQIRNLRNAYKILYRSELPLSEAVQRLSELVPTQPELKILVDFIAASERRLAR